MSQQHGNDEQPVGYGDLPAWMRAWIILAFAVLLGCVLLFVYIGATANPPDDEHDVGAAGSANATAVWNADQLYVSQA